MSHQIIGYARVSTSHQQTDRQVDVLKENGCSVVYNEVISSRTPEDQRPQLQACLQVLETGDELVLTALSRLGRTQLEVINRLHDLQMQRSLCKNSQWTHKHKGTREDGTFGHRATDWVLHP